MYQQQQQQMQAPGMSPDQLKDAFYKTNFTLKGRIFHPNLLATRNKTNAATGSSRDVYDVMFVWDPADPSNGPELNKLLGFMAQMTPMLFVGRDPRSLVDPIKSDKIQGRQDYVRQDYKPNQPYLHHRMWINAETGKDQAPVVVMANRQPVLSEAEVYSGRNAVVNFQLYPMLPDAQKPQKKVGYGVNLNAVMLLDGGEKEGGRTQVDPNTVFGAFAQDMGMAPSFGAPMGAPVHNQQQYQAPQQNYAQQAPAHAPAPAWGNAPAPAPTPAAPWGAPPATGMNVANPGHAPGAAPTSNGQQQPPWMNNTNGNFNPGNGQ